MVPFLEWVVGAIVWVLANAVYVDLRRRGVRGFGRFAAFWAGFPMSFFWRAMVQEGAAPSPEPPEDDEDELLREVRLDRERRALREAGK